MSKTNPCGCGGLSLRPGAPGGINQPCHGYTGGVEPHQGHVTPNPRIVVVYWDQYFTNTPAAVQSMDQFLSDLATGGFWDGLRQYGVGAASFAGHAIINMTTYPTPNSQNPGQAFSETQMQNQLIAWLDANVVSPKPVGDEVNLVYLIVAPSDTTLSLGGTVGGFCGYHKSGKYNANTLRDNLIWATVTGYQKANTGQAFVNSISFCVSHELSEAFSNPDQQGWFRTVSNNECEIGDICEASANGNCCITVPYKTWQVENYWSNLDANCIIGPVEPRYVTGTEVAASQQFGLTQTDVFVVNKNGTANVLWVVEAGIWTGGPIGSARAFPPGAPLAASQQFGLVQTDVFIVDNNGTVNVLWVVDAGGWAQGPIGPAGNFPRGAHIAASQQFGLTQTDVFVVDNSGTLWVLWVVEAGAWAAAPIGPAGMFPPGAPVAASQQFGLDQTDVFIVDKNGTLNVMWVVGAGAWAGPEPIGPAGIFPRGAHIAASQQFGLTQTDVFVVDNNGTVNVMWVVGAGGWSSGPIGSPGMFPRGANIAASQQIGLTQTDVFVVDNNGTLNVLWVVGAGGWSSGPIGPAGMFPRGAPLTASQQFGLFQTDVFAVDNGGTVDVLWVVGGGAWSGPGPLT